MSTVPLHPSTTALRGARAGSIGAHGVHKPFA